MPNYYMNFNKFNNYIITNYSFELIHDKKELLNKENDLSKELLFINYINLMIIFLLII